MAAEDVYHLLAEAEHTEENWKKAWPMLRKNTALEPLGVELVSVDADQIVLRMEITANSRQPFGLLHGGISILLAESAASMHSCWGLDIPRRVPVGIEINGSHLRSATHGVVLATAKVIRRGATLVHHNVTISEEATGQELSTVRVTNLIRKMA